MQILAAKDIPLEGDIYLYYFLCVAGGGLVGWCIEYFRGRFEIRKLKAEIITLTGDTLKNIQSARNEYKTSCAECTLAASALIDLISREAILEDISKSRESLCKILLEQTIPTYHSYAEWKHLQLSGSPKELKDFLLDDVVAELRRFHSWLVIINREELIKRLDKCPPRLAKNSITPFYQLTKGLRRGDRKFVDTQLRRAGTDLIEIGN